MYFDFGPAKILVADHFQPSRMAAARSLNVDGYIVLETDNGSKALEIVDQELPDLVLLETRLPELDGFEVCRRLRNAEKTRLLPVVFMTKFSNRQDRLRGIAAGGDDFFAKSFDQQVLSARIKSLVERNRVNDDLICAEQVLFSMAQAIEERDPSTGEHCQRLVEQAKRISRFLKLSSADTQSLVRGAALHDIGKVTTPDRILLKPGKLSPAEWVIMRQHVIMGEQICRPLKTLRGVLPIIRHHHERWDGSGYPDGLAGDEIPFLAQVFQCLDVYDALTSQRAYKPAFSPEKALTVMRAETAKGWYNPALMEIFMQFIKQESICAIAWQDSLPSS